MEVNVTTNAIEITLENFQQIILEESKSKLVLVDFWAAQVPESLELKDKLAIGLQGFEQYILYATVDCQTQQQIAQQFGIQGLPTAILVKDGQPLDGLTGPQDDDNIKEFLANHLPKEEDLLLIQAQKLLADNNINDAFTVINSAYQLNSERADIKLMMADVYLQTGKISEAESLLTTILMVDQDSHYQALIAKLELASQAADSPEIKALEAQLVDDVDNIALQHQLVAQYSQVNRHEEALTLLFRLMQKDSSDAASKDLYLDVLKALPDGDPLANKFRRKLYTLMY
ncbi:tetratricopeptide repeat protein [Colwellia sp. BRX8-3]|jgi:putative thioredoxin|nr:tetratricopeptide repeat protein [Colwellia sp. BRX8-7]MBA6347012.1 tetratricopeptide repeat protein [Colwellia sp. BRX8-9]MBA6350647.1 tetratricopeptide repeat protein [Colwellia sp. BRX9-1]MBA6354263.1 tetratricopeptide repeat protein [Colwellia sp. BRX8-3]MBA6358470.1 tetratricopeptide repeat protein [Colwellia sp. BRX8-6]MBA6367828.1 tetratricopeptide repeat protein [Colwellia sp. BRX8-5]MBA6370155.1 tetratricopeptide repeat protein [Colwellia sp. BRX8-4]MBA6374309.1 tetratricopeptide